MTAKKGDYIVFRLDTGEKKEGIVVDSSMGMFGVMVKDSSYTVRGSEIAENKGNIFELMKSDG